MVTATTAGAGCRAECRIRSPQSPVSTPVLLLLRLLAARLCCLGRSSLGKAVAARPLISAAPPPPDVRRLTVGSVKSAIWTVDKTLGAWRLPGGGG